MIGYSSTRRVEGVASLRMSYERLVGSLEEKERELIRLREIKEEGEKLAEVMQGASELLLEVAIEHQAAVLHFLDGIVTKGLQDVFGADVEVEFREVTRANARAIDIIFKRGGSEIDIPDGVGGGVTALVSLLVQLSMIYLLRGSRRQIIFLDESLAHLASVYVPAAAKVLRDICDSLGIQVVMVTHQEEFTEAADVVYNFTYHKDGTKIERL